MLFKETFGIQRSAGSIVVGDRVVSDGHTIDDLSVVSLKSLQEYLGTTEDHWDKLLQLTINKMENPNVDTNNNPEPTSEVEQGPVSKGRRGKKAKETDKGETVPVS